MKKALIQRVEEALDTIRPYMIADNGNVRIVQLTKKNVLELEFTGCCSSCPMSTMTFQAGVREAVIKAVPEITEIEVLNLVYPEM